MIDSHQSFESKRVLPGHSSARIPSSSGMPVMVKRIVCGDVCSRWQLYFSTSIMPQRVVLVSIKVPFFSHFRQLMLKFRDLLSLFFLLLFTAGSAARRSASVALPPFSINFRALQIHFHRNYKRPLSCINCYLIRRFAQTIALRVRPRWCCRRHPIAGRWWDHWIRPIAPSWRYLILLAPRSVRCAWTFAATCEN